MSFILGPITLLNPKRYTKSIIEVGTEHLLIYGKTTKHYQGRKYQHILEYLYLTQAQINSITSLFEQGNIVSFSVNDGSLLVNPVDVLIEIKDRSFPPTGKLYREHITIVLTEVGSHITV
jgi:hypothetical protein